MHKQKFYEQPTDASRVKQAIVATYFGAWKNVLKTWRNKPTLGYCDLYSGPGTYLDGSFSTPLLILQQALEDAYLREHLVTVFNDANVEITSSLRRNIDELPGIQQLRHKPAVYNYEVSDTVINLRPNGPTLLFADPWGYKGLSITLIANFMEVAGSDCIFFFNYNRINAGLNWKGFAEPLDLVFGQSRANALRSKIGRLMPSERERVIVAEMQAALKEIGACCALPFRFVSAHANRPSHHLLFASKHALGCRIMKNIMRDNSSAVVQGVGSFEFTGTVRIEQQVLPGLGPLDDLKNDLLQRFAHETVTLDRLISQHNHPTAVERNYREAILQLEAENGVSVTVPGRERRRQKSGWTLPKDSLIRFT